MTGGDRRRSPALRVVGPPTPSASAATAVGRGGAGRRPVVLAVAGVPGVLWVCGRVVSASALALLEALELALVSRQGVLVVLDLSRVRAIDMAGLNVLLEIRAQQVANYGDVALRRVPEPLGALIMSTGRTDLFASSPR